VIRAASSLDLLVDATVVATCAGSVLEQRAHWIG
jgi:hypothetical protein